MTRAARILSLAAMLAFPFVSAGAQSTGPPAFEVASIRLHPGRPGAEMDFKMSGTFIRMEGYNFGELVMEAYQVKNYQISLPKGLNSEDYYDLAIRAPGDSPPSREEARRMLQTLLADRFKLAIHRETKVIPVYALVVGKNGPIFKENTSNDECKSHAGPRTQKARTYVYELSGCPIDTLVEYLTQTLGDRPVVDQTGLTGKYNITLEATPNFMMTARSDPDDISVFTAIRTLGLKLQAQRAPVQIIVVDHIEKPSEN